MRIDLTVRDPAGREQDLAVLAPEGTNWAQVAPLLGTVTHHDIDAPDGVGANVPLGYGGVLSGRIVGAAPTKASGATHALDVVGGPDAGRSVPVAHGPVTIGRLAGCELVLRDPDVSRIHARIEFTSRGPQLRDEGSSNGTSVGELQVGTTPVPLSAGSYARVGDSFLTVRAGAIPAALTKAGADGTVLVSRPPQSRHEPTPREITIPAEPRPPAPQRVPWLAALMPAVLAGGLAIGMHAAQFLLFALLSPVAMLAGSLGTRLHARSAHRGERARYQREASAADLALRRALAAEIGARREADPDPAAISRIACRPGAQLWSRPLRRPGALSVRIGLGAQPSRTRVSDGSGSRTAATIRDVPVTVDLRDGPLGLVGPRAPTLGVGRWIVGQLSVRVSPADVELVLLLSPGAAPAWRWTRWLPHVNGRIAVTPDERRALLAELVALRHARTARGAGDGQGRQMGRWVVAIMDRCAELDGVAGNSELFDDCANAGITAICIDSTPAALPAGCARVARVAGETGSRLRLDDPPIEVIGDQVGARWAERVARALAPLRDATGGDAGALPATCSLLPLLGANRPDAQSLAARWRQHRSVTDLTAVLGVAADGPLALDLVRDGPHALVAGTTGSGKSELLRTLVAGLAAEYPPESVVFVLVDYKGGAAFAECATLPHTVGVVTDLDSHLAARALRSLERELARREELFAGSGARDLAEYRTQARGEAVPRLVIVVDEFAELARELEQFVSGLVAVARRGRSLGIHLVLATQRPGSVVSPEIRANTAIRIALRVTDPAESYDVIDSDAAALIERHRPGRAYLRLTGSPAVVLQTARVGEVREARPSAPRVLPLDDWRRLPEAQSLSGSTDLQLLVAAARGAAHLCASTPPARPWLEPLPEQLPLSGLDAGSQTQVPLGLTDLPHEQRQVVLHADVAAGASLLFAGGPRSGRTSALLALAVGAAAKLAPEHLHVHLIDFAGGGLAPATRLPHLGTHVESDIATAAALIERLAAEVARRRIASARATDRPGTHSAAPSIVCLLDGWEAFAAAVDAHDNGATIESLLDMLRSGPSVGVTVALSGDRGALAVRPSAAVATKVLLRLTDRADYALAGLAERAVPSAQPPGRAVLTDATEVQLGYLGKAPGRAEQLRAAQQAAQLWREGRGAAAQPPIRVRPLPDRVRLDALPRHGGRVTIGVAGDQAEPVSIDLFAGSGRLLVAGAPRAGKSTALACILAGLPDGLRIIIAATPRSPLPRAGSTRELTVLRPEENWRPPSSDTRTVLLVDDCELFTDSVAGDALAAWLRSSPPGLAVVAAGCADELAITFRGVTAEVRRSRCTLLLQPRPADGELAGLNLARRRDPGPPGRGVLVGDRAWGEPFTRGPVPIQLAQP